jgi:hypothetical protein
MLLVFAQSPYSSGDRVFVLDELGINYKIINQLDDYLSLDANYKLAIITDFKLHPRLTEISQKSNLVFCICHELHPDYLSDLKIGNNIYWSLPGVINFINDHSFNGFWLYKTAQMYEMLRESHNLDKLSELQPYNTKPKYFDCLLGSVKDHRTFIYNSINDAELNNQIILNYNPDAVFNFEKFYADDYFIWEPGTVPNPGMTILDTASWVSYCGIECHLSCIIPIEVYNKSCYSIVAETNFDNEYSFYTEKIAKPMLARRLFVVFSGYRYLHNLKKIGFQTFNGIIDESYDLIEDPIQRFNAAFKEVIKLCQLPQEKILDLIQPITEHNYQYIKKMSWRSQDHQWMRNLILEKLNLTTT